MKKALLLLVIILSGATIAPAGFKTDNNKKNDKPGSAGTKNVENNSGKLTPPSPSVIDQYDSVVFDISQAVVIGSYIEFPVYFDSDDFVYAFDFSLKYNQLNFVFDTIIDLTTYLLDNSFYNPNDSTIRFTSSSLTPITNNIPLVKIRFDTLAGTLCSSDINTLKGYLNGDMCSIKVIDCIPLGITENDLKDNMVAIFPNPGSGIINIRFNTGAVQSYQVIVTDITGKMVYANKFVSTFGINQASIDLQNLSKGIYQLQMISSSHSHSQKLVIE